MDDPTELANAAANANGRRGETIYEVLNHDRIKDGEYMTIGTTFQGDTNHTKSKKLEETFAEQATSLSILKWICVVLGITVVIISVTFGVLIHELMVQMGRIKDSECIVVDGGWTDWSFWSSCSVSCGNGQSIRQRSCTYPTPTNGGLTCTGPRTEQNRCIINSCSIPNGSADAGWADWSFWSSCSVTCGNGHAIRQRFCLIPTKGTSTCTGTRAEQNTCNSGNCPVNGGWSTWTSWSSCNSSAARGLSQRQRTCTSPSPVSLGRGCIGDATDKRPCSGVKSAFTVSNPVAVTPHKVRFTHVITNIGGHYSNSTGVFTCQYSGLYVFDLHIMMIPGRDFAFCRIIKNGGGVLSALLRPDSKSINGYYGTSNSVVIHLVRGDIVGLGDCSSIHTDFDFDTTFLGFLIEAD